MTTKLVNCQKFSYNVYIGRSKNKEVGKWGNPYSYKEDSIAEFKVKDKKESLEKYENYLRNNQELLNQLDTLDGKILGCWCHPKNQIYKEGDTIVCHGQIIQKIIQERKIKPLF